MDSSSSSQPPTKLDDDSAPQQIGDVGGLQGVQPHINLIAPVLDDARGDIDKDATSTASREPGSAITGENVEPERPEPALAYGTRSRNRTRVNYAEDQDMPDFDLVAPPAKTALAKNSSMSEIKRSQQAPSDAKIAVTDISSARFVALNGADRPEKSPSSGRDAVNGPSTSSSASQKKRKVGGNSASIPSAPGQVAVAQPTTKRPNAAASGYVPIANTMSRASNMLTFRKSGAVLRASSLVADDGTALRVDGQSDLT